VYPNSTIPLTWLRTVELSFGIAPAITAVPWLRQRQQWLKQVQAEGIWKTQLYVVHVFDTFQMKREKERDETYLYPPATTGVLGHLVYAKLNNLAASFIASCVVPPGSAFSARPAVYGPPTPWTQTLFAPYLLSRAFPTVGPAVVPYKNC
jgi:hypothetical protein